MNWEVNKRLNFNKKLMNLYPIVYKTFLREFNQLIRHINDPTRFQLRQRLIFGPGSYLTSIVYLAFRKLCSESGGMSIARGPSFLSGHKI